MVFEPGGDGSNANASLTLWDLSFVRNDGNSGGRWDYVARAVPIDRSLLDRGSLHLFLVAERYWKVKVNYVLMWRMAISK